jgi:ketosteroid isomerase-like protein
MTLRHRIRDVSNLGGCLRRAIASGVVVALVFAVGCRSTWEDQIRATTKAYYDALAEGDGNKACAQLTADGKLTLQGTARSCQAQVAAFARRARGSDVPDQLRSAEPVKVNIVSRKATATSTFRGQKPETLGLDMVGGQWKISDPGDRMR